MDIWMMIGLVATIGVIAGLSIYSGTKVKGGEAAKNGAPIIAGVIIGTLVGGSSTVGTAQLAYNYGMSAWWFTLGGGIACLILALVYVKPLRAQNCPTLVGMIRKEYGDGAGMAASVLNSVGTFINIISQLISATAVLAVIFPTMGVVPELIISALFMVLYVVFGGTKGAGMVGVLKTILLYVAMMGCAGVVLALVGGVGPFVDLVHSIDNPEGVNFFSLFARGAGEDIGAGLSLILGVLTTQTYAQAVLSGKSDDAGRKGALLSAVLIPPIGVGGILVGLYMRATHPGIVAKTALTAFTLEYMPPVLAGVILGTLFVAVVGTGAGLALGISTIVNNDIVKKLTHRFDSPVKSGLLSKLCIVIVLAVACCLSTGSLGDTILQFAFMSMGLRGAVVFVPLCAALWLPGRIDRKFALASIVAGPVIVLLFGTALSGVLPFDSLFAGIFAALVIMGVGLAVSPKRARLG
ncbi:MAG: sodium:solute symporter family protein [Oscillospiraceae bacterium]|nr:sodium:solute symporter family protein [Oscillospiraceae bacterium]